MSSLYTVILAAGNSTRLKSSLSKVLHPLCGRPLLDYILDLSAGVKAKKTVLVLGKDREQVIQACSARKQLIFAHQKERLGTAHAAQVGLKILNPKDGKVLVLSGDVPRLTLPTLKKFIRAAEGQPLAFLTAVLPNPYGYGRILRNANGEIQEVKEEKNASETERQLNEINAGIYLVEAKLFKQLLQRIKKDPVKGEFYLTDIVAAAVASGIQPQATVVEDVEEILGANTRAELAYLQQLFLHDLIRFHLERGVGMQDPQNVYLDAGVTIGEDTWLGAGVQLLGKTKVGKGCLIEAGAILRDVVLADQVQVRAYSYLEDCQVRSQAVIGPFARLRPQTLVEEAAQVGNFVELKKTRLGKGSKANHLTYLGDAIIGKAVNIGAGTITCNYDGKNKFQTRIADGVFIGSDTQLVAPVSLGENAYVAAGTTVTKNIPKGALAVSRTPQKNIQNFKQKRSS